MIGVNQNAEIAIGSLQSEPNPEKEIDEFDAKELTRKIHKKGAKSPTYTFLSRMWQGRHFIRKSSPNQVFPEPGGQIISSKHSSQLVRWDFDVGIEINHLKQIDDLQTMFGLVGAHMVFDVSFDDFGRFLNEMKLGYAEAPGLPFHRFYHNFTHALDVTQTLFAMLHFMKEEDDPLEGQEKAVTLLAALGHDIHHPGVSNHYVVVSKHQYALEYGDSLGVLEKMHAVETKRIVQKYGLFNAFDQEVK